MSHGLGVSVPAGRDAEKSRLQLKPHALASTYLDGAWWPRSTQLPDELLGLVEALSDRLGALAVVGYHLNAWTQAPPQMQIDGQSVQLQGFTSDEPATVILIGHDGRCITLQVISPAATGIIARQELDAASANFGDSPPADNRAERVIARSVTEVAAQLARHEGRSDPERTAEIAQWCEEAAQQFVDAPIQAFVPILVHHIVRNRMGAPHTAV